MAAAFAMCFALLLATAATSDATFCVCNSGLGDPVLQKNLDYACGAGADCSAILQNGACFNPNTVKDHCNYAVNSYYQRKGQTPGSCNFSGTATITPNAPNSGSGCVYQSSPSSTIPTSSRTPPGMYPGSIVPPGSDSNDNAGAKLLSRSSTRYTLLSLFTTFLIYGSSFSRIRRND